MGTPNKNDLNNIIDFFNKLEASNCDFTIAIKILLLTIVICMLLALVLPIVSCLIVGAIVFIVLYLAALLNIIA